MKRQEVWYNKKEVIQMKKAILVSGLSGAGKSSASSILEDMGYHCIDQYPVQLLDLLVDLVNASNDPRYQNIVLTMPLNDLPQFIQAFKGSEIDVQTLFLEANTETLLSRYKSTRRTHPLLISNVANTLEESILAEKAAFNKIKDPTCIMIDTSHLKFLELKHKIEKYFAISNEVSFSVSFISFGYKNGVPLDADLMFDVRFLPNPYWIESLRLHSGDDACVYDYVMEHEETKAFIEKFHVFLDYLFAQYVKEGKNHLTIGIGCTGGQHRSVSITNYLFKIYKDRYRCFKDHRDKVDYYEQ